MSDSKCFCHLMGFEVKDAKARKMIENNNVINAKNYGFVDDGVTDNREYTSELISAIPDDGGYIRFPRGHYVFGLIGNKQSVFKFEGKKNLIVDLDGSTLEILSNGFPYYNFFELIDCENFKIINGVLKGDRLTHDYNSVSGTHEFGYGVNIASSLSYQRTADENGEYNPKDIGVPSDNKCCGLLENLEIYDFTGDGILTRNGLSPGVITVKNCDIHHNRRQGISVLATDTLIVEDCHIHHIGTFDGVVGANPQSGIDVEPDCDTYGVNSVQIRNTIIDNTTCSSVVSVNRTITKTETSGDGTTKETEYVSTVVKEFVIENSTVGTVTLEMYAELGETVNYTSPVIRNSTINHNKCQRVNTATKELYDEYRPNVIYKGVLFNTTINSVDDPDWYVHPTTGLYRQLFVAGLGDDGLKLYNCVINGQSTSNIIYCTLKNCSVNNGRLLVAEVSETNLDTINNCYNTIFSDCVLHVRNAILRKYGFFGCSFIDMKIEATSGAHVGYVKFRNCYFNNNCFEGSTETPNCINCTIEDEDEV